VTAPPSLAELRALRDAALEAAAHPHIDPAILARAAVDGLADCYQATVDALGYGLEEQR
jgi:hypothetical protein